MKWNEYSSLSVEEKEKFFVKNESAEVVNMRSFVQPQGSMKARIIAKQQCQFISDADIMETLIFGLLFNNSEEEGEEDNSFNIAKKNALRNFIRNDEDNTFVIEVEDDCQFCGCWCVISTGKQVVPISEGRNWNGCYGIHFGT